MLENRVLRYTAYFVGASVLSEIIYRGYQYVRDRLRRRDADEVSDVIWTNELTQSCSAEHFARAKKQNELNQSTAKDIVSPPKNVHQCSNEYCTTKNVGRMIEFIDQANHCIDLAMYTFTSYDLSQAFMRAIRRGVAVRIISDKEMVYSSGSQIIILTNAGAAVRSPSTTMLMHHKFCILDGAKRARTITTTTGKRYNHKKARSIVMSGSLNWTMQGLGGNWENVIITSNKTLSDKFESEFERMWLSMSS